MTESSLIKSASEKISKDFKIDDPLSTEVESNIAEDELKEYLKHKIMDLMENNLERFLNTLYRIDVDENKVRDIFKKKSGFDIAESLADLIIQRQIQRVKTQQMYKQGRI
jgi:hypothetical protein